METDKVNQPVNFQIIQESHDNEVNLYEMWQVLNQYKYYMIFTIILCVLAALVYLFSLSPVYQANAYIVSAEEVDIVNLNFDSLEDQSIYNTTSVFQKFINVFNSKVARNLFNEQESSLSGVCNNITISTSIDSTTNQHQGVISFSSNDAEHAAKCINEYISFTHKLTVKNLRNEVEERIHVNKKKLARKINILRESAKKNKEEAIIVLTEALNIAEKLGLKEMSTKERMFFFSLESKDTKPSLQMEMFYRKGTAALSLELETLKNRKNNDPFTPGLRKLEKEYNYLDAKLRELPENAIEAIIIDQQAVVPGPVPPKSKLIILLGLVSGILSSLVLVFILIVFNKLREQSRKEQE